MAMVWLYVCACVCLRRSEGEGEDVQTKHKLLLNCQNKSQWTKNDGIKINAQNKIKRQKMTNQTWVWNGIPYHPLSHPTKMKRNIYKNNNITNHTIKFMQLNLFPICLCLVKYTQIHIHWVCACAVRPFSLHHSRNDAV